MVRRIGAPLQEKLRIWASIYFTCLCLAGTTSADGQEPTSEQF